MHKIRDDIRNLTDDVKSWFTWVGVIFAISLIVFLKDIAILMQTNLLFYNITNQELELELWRVIFFIIALMALVISVILAFYAYSGTNNANILFNTLMRTIMGIVIIFVLEVFYVHNAWFVNVIFSR